MWLFCLLLLLFCFICLFVLLFVCMYNLVCALSWFGVCILAYGQSTINHLKSWSLSLSLLNTDKTKSMVVATHQKRQCGIPPLHLVLNSQVIEQVSEHCYCGVFLDDQLNGKLILTVTLRAPLSGTFLQTLPDLVTPLKGHSLSPRSCPPTRSAPSERFRY